MLMWIILGILIIAGLIFIKLEHHSRAIIFIILLIMGILIYFSLTSTMKNNNLDIATPKDVISGLSIYFNWIVHTAGQLWEIGIETTGRVIQTVEVNETKIN